MQRAAKHIMLSQIWFYTFLAVCFVLVPRNGTISYYGNLKRTIIPYAGGRLSALAVRFLPVRAITYIVARVARPKEARA